MALINCQECRKQVSSLAKACPHCGRPTSKRKCSPRVKFNKGKQNKLISEFFKNNNAKWLIGATAILLFFLLIYALYPRSYSSPIKCDYKYLQKKFNCNDPEIEKKWSVTNYTWGIGWLSANDLGNDGILDSIGLMYGCKVNDAYNIEKAIKTAYKMTCASQKVNADFNSSQFEKFKAISLECINETKLNPKPSNKSCHIYIHDVEIYLSTTITRKYSNKLHLIFSITSADYIKYIMNR